MSTAFVIDSPRLVAQERSEFIERGIHPVRMILWPNSWGYILGPNRDECSVRAQNHSSAPITNH
jgi:hypothetical protein